MKKLNKSLLTMVLVALMAFVCAFVSLGFVNSGVSASADELARPVTADTAAADDFYVVNGARVRVTESQSGIAFGSFVTKGFHDKVTKNGEVEVEYFATAQVAGGKNWSAIRFPIQPSFAEGAADTELFELRTYINFGYGDDDPKRLAAYATDFAIETYVNAGGTFYKAFDVEKGIARSMQAVANAADLDFADTNKDGAHDEWGYTKADLAKYFTVGKRSSKVTAYIFDDATSYVTLPGANGADGTKVKMYDGAKSIGEFTYKADRNTYVGTLPKEGIISAFVGGKVYSTVAADAIKIEDAEGMKQLQTSTSASDIFVIDKDIDMSSITEWSTTDNNDASAFKGILDGMQHKIYNYTVRGGGLFGRTKVATVKNLHFEVKGYSNFRYSGVVAKRSFDTVYDNVYVDVLSQNQTGVNSASGLFGIAGGDSTTTVKNCVVAMRAISVVPSFATAIKNSDGDAFFVTRVEGETDVINSYGLNGTNYTLNFAGCEVNADKLKVEGKTSSNAAITSSSVLGILDLDSTKLANDFLKACYAKTKEAFTVTELTQANFQEKLMGATSGYFVLTEDIDMGSMTWEPSGASFSGVIDGQGHSIKNFTSSSTKYKGFLPNVSNAIVRNLNMHIVSNKNRSALTGQITGPFTVENCVFDVDNLTNATSSGVIANVVQGVVTVNNVVINIDSAGANAGIVAGSESSSKNVVVSNCYFATTLTKVFEGDNYAVNAETGVVTEGTVGTDNALAVAGEDYMLYKSQGQLCDAAAAGEIPSDLVEGMKKIGLITPINKDNIRLLEAAHGGYFYLTEDIDMIGIDWAPTADMTTDGVRDTSDLFKGTLNGNGYTISNFTAPAGNIGLIGCTGAS